jgi:mono/diheme cytochrome c family protein
MRGRCFLLFFLLGVTVPAPAAEDAEVFVSRCAICHGRDGSARTPQGRKVKARDLRASRLTDTEIERQIRDGSRNKTGGSVMPAFGPDLTDAQIQAAVRVVKSFRQP